MVTTLGGRAITLTLEGSTPAEVKARAISLVPDHQVVATVDGEAGYSQRHHRPQSEGRDSRE